MAIRNFIPLYGSLVPQQQNPSFFPSANPADVVTVKTGLAKMGLYPSDAINDQPDSQMFNGISTYQREQRLPQTGAIAPGDGTHNRMANSLTSSLFYDHPNNWYQNWLDKSGGQPADTSFAAQPVNLGALENKAGCSCAEWDDQPWRSV